MNEIPMSLPDINETDIQAVIAVVRSGRLALGPQTVEFERLVAEYAGVQHALAVSFGLDNLRIGCYSDVV